MAELIELNLADNNGLGTLPPSIGNLQNLQKLDVRYCGLTTLPASFGNLKRLEYLQMWGNEFTELPHSILEMTALRDLHLNHNKLTTLPSGITKLSITYIDTHMNYLCDVPKDVDAWLAQRDRQYKEHQYCDNVKHF
jgi:Leucine-rich repeat (LRR) protein